MPAGLVDGLGWCRQCPWLTWHEAAHGYHKTIPANLQVVWKLLKEENHGKMAKQFHSTKSGILKVYIESD